MATPIPNGFYLAKLRWRLVGDSEEMISTLALRGNEPGERDASEVAEAVYKAWAGAWETDGMITGWSFVGVDVQTTEEGDPGGPTQGGAVIGTYNEISNGVGGGAALPNNCALLIKKKTARGGRRNSGRMFIPPAYLAEANVDATGLITSEMSTYQAQTTQFYDNLRDSTQPVGQPATSFMPVLLHSDPLDGSGNPVPGTAPEPTDITSFVVDPRIATQRQRMRR